jgi:hypothetical protein
LVTLLDDPGSDRIVADLGQAGAECAVVGPVRAFAARSRFTRRVFPLPSRGGAMIRSLALAFRLESIARGWSPDRIVPLDDLAARALRDPGLLRRAGPALSRVLEASLGDPEHFDVACSRQALLGLAERIGVRTPRQEIVPDLAAAKRAAARLGYPVVLKREQSCGGAGVNIVHDEKSLARAFRREWARAAAKRRLGWIPGYRLSDRVALTLQEYISGDLAFRVSACGGGDEREGFNLIAEARHPDVTGASTRVRALESAEMRDAARRLTAALRCEGVISLDFILTPMGEAYLVELNARPVASGHLGRLFGHDVYAAAFGLDPAARPPPPAPPRVVALFPRELDRDPDSPYLTTESGVHHDVPWDDPDLVAAYSAWLDARHPERLGVARGLVPADAPRVAAPAGLLRGV